MGLYLKVKSMFLSGMEAERKEQFDYILTVIDVPSTWEKLSLDSPQTLPQKCNGFPGGKPCSRLRNQPGLHFPWGSHSNYPHSHIGSSLHSYRLFFHLVYTAFGSLPFFLANTYLSHGVWLIVSCLPCDLSQVSSGFTKVLHLKFVHLFYNSVRPKFYLSLYIPCPDQKSPKLPNPVKCKSKRLWISYRSSPQYIYSIIIVICGVYIPGIPKKMYASGLFGQRCSSSSSL